MGHGAGTRKLTGYAGARHNGMGRARAIDQPLRLDIKVRAQCRDAARADDCAQRRLTGRWVWTHAWPVTRAGVQRKLSARSDRVKSVDFHPSEPWVMTCLYNGNVYIWNYDNQV